MFIAFNKLAVPPAHQQAVIEAFEKHSDSMKQIKGFLGMELWTGEDNSIVGVSRWESREAMEAYTKSEHFGAHHAASREEQLKRPDITYYTSKEIV
ncbi:antibiotic biosynthesis monooxygenase family protein [Ktedonosporobacter rubrisoli]|nr:antibiotic biosynthesis monooxygenase family protein [Ktedonosporobacter rubrisoli]